MLRASRPGRCPPPVPFSRFGVTRCRVDPTFEGICSGCSSCLTRPHSLSQRSSPTVPYACGASRKNPVSQRMRSGRTSSASRVCFAPRLRVRSSAIQASVPWRAQPSRSATCRGLVAAQMRRVSYGRLQPGQKKCHRHGLMLITVPSRSKCPCVDATARRASSTQRQTSRRPCRCPASGSPRRPRMLSRRPFADRAC
jgi:hypothetical protein